MIIAEKPSAAQKIAESLAEKKPKKVGEKTAVWFEFTKSGKKYVSVPAVGHLFSLKQKGKGWKYPMFDVEWVPSFVAAKTAAFSEKYFRNIEKLVAGADDFIIATDYDTEGDVIGFNILRFLCNKEDAKRMKFSTMTKDELNDSFETAAKHINFNQTEAGLARHYLDWYWGVNLTRALTLAIKNASSRFMILSTGRVQGPVLHMLAKHEARIKAFKSKPFWEILLKLKIGSNIMDATHATEKFWDKKEADATLAKAKKGKAIVSDVKLKLFQQAPPKPYNTTAMLADIYRYFGYTPQQGLSIAESLYQDGLISYPRTSSEQLPENIGYKEILSKLAKQKRYEADARFVLEAVASGRKPEQGKRTDPAHPAIYPTGETPKKLGDKKQRVYDLVVRRFFAAFGTPAKRESMRVELDVNGERFLLMGKRTIDPGWTKLYGIYTQREEVLLPKFKKGDKLDIKSIEELSKETQPPQRFSQGSVLKEMEQRGLGTKATRAQILQTLYNRGYLLGKSIEVTDLGLSIANILEKNAPDIISEKLTRHFEELTDDIQAGKQKRDDVLEEAKRSLIKTLEDFRKHEAKVGKELTKSVIETQEQASLLGPCPKCGSMLKVHKSWRTKKRFVGCSGYPKCTYGMPLPALGRIDATDKICDQCKSPIIQVFREGKRPFRTCVDIHCPTKKDWMNKKMLASSVKKEDSKKENKKDEKKPPVRKKTKKK